MLPVTTHNRLISTPRGKSKSSRIEIVDELSSEVFRQLVVEKKAMSFVPGEEESESDETGGDGDFSQLYQPEDETTAVNGIAQRHADARLQTTLASEALQKRLLATSHDSRTFEEEQGVNILYLAMGFLKWFEAPSSDRARFAPLLLIPVELERQSAGSRFKLKLRDEEIGTNLSLQAKLEAEFGVRLPDVPELDDLAPLTYFAAVEKAIETQARWEVLPNDMVLWFFSFAKFLMYRDLEPERWPEGNGLAFHPMVMALLDQGFATEPPICGDDDKIDPIIQPIDLVHVMDADSSQAVAIEEVKRGRNLVIQGPPGTGKSQTIANLIAMAVKENKTVLFVAEKMAALEVVKRRLDKVDLGDMCFELHSHKANKRTVLADLGKTLNLGRPKTQSPRGLLEELTFVRDKLNGHVEIMHQRLPQSQLTPYQVIGSLVRLRARNVPPADFELVEAAKWTPQQRMERVNLLHDVALHMQGIGVPANHPWRGVTIEALLPMDLDRLQPRLRALIQRLDRLISATSELGRELHAKIGDSATDASAVARLGQRLAAAPDLDRKSIADEVWRTRREDISNLLKTGQALYSCQLKLKGVVVESAWSVEVRQTRRVIAAHGRSWLRWFSREYREASAKLRGILLGEPPRLLQDRLQILDTLSEAQSALWNVTITEGNVEVGRRAFGSKWRGVDSDWTALEAIDNWENECRQARLPTVFREIMARLDDMSTVKRLLKQIAADLRPSLQEAQVVFHGLGLNLQAAFGETNLNAIPLENLKSRLQSWCDDAELLTKWINFRNRWVRLEACGLAGLATKLYDGSITPESAEDRFYISYYEQVLREVVRACPTLAEFDGQSHERLLAQFKERDQQRIALAKHEVALAHHAKIPRGHMGIGEVGLVQREIEKKRKHLPIRKLLKEAGTAIQAIKPVFMMSPISIAQFLEPGHLKFDLLLIDEASQVNPVDALGAIARAQQIVVVGDDKQLPPTRFFDKVLADGDEDGTEDSFSASDVESILGLCMAQGMPQRMLRWHYRSRHDSLIAVSNREFYGNRLFVVPSADKSSPDHGLHFRHVSEGIFDRGGSATNRIEARRVAQAAMDHARSHPEQSLGIGAFSVAQRDAIRNELELLRREDTSCESFFAPGNLDPFFIKNLENIQGDERDVIFISVGYSRDSDGNLAMNFGPLQTDGGERRLNVLISRARDRCEVFSSITAADIDLARARSRGAAAFKAFLHYAETGILDIGTATGRGYDSDFEEEVARALQGYGFRIDSQVGLAGFFIDLAVVDPEQPGRYLLGIECDGATYHSSRSARDRDRLREAILRSRGWVIHRIWSTDWFHRPEDQIRKTLAAIDQAKSEWASRNGSGTKRIAAVESPTAVVRVERTEEVPPTDGGSALISSPYEEASFTAPQSAVADMPAGELKDLLVRILQIEGPIHADELTRRAVELTGGSRAGKLASDAVRRCLRSLLQQRVALVDNECYWIAGESKVPVRNRADVRSPNLRKPDMLPRVEIRQALAAVVATNAGAAIVDVVTAVSRALGFAATSAQLRELIQREIDELRDNESVVCRDGKLYLH